MDKHFNSKKEFFSITELSKLLNISRQAVFKKIKNGQIKADKVGRNYIIHKKNIRDIIYDELTDKVKTEIGKGVAKVIREYGDTLKMLGDE